MEEKNLELEQMENAEELEVQPMEEPKKKSKFKKAVKVVGRVIGGVILVGLGYLVSDKGKKTDVVVEE